MTRKRLGLVVGLPAAALAVFIGASQPCAARPRADDGYLAGTVRDRTGHGLPTAEVLALSELSGEEFSVKSDEDGRYRLPLPVGAYTVGVSFPSFRACAVSDVTIKSGRDVRLNATLEVVPVEETFPVKSDCDVHGTFVTSSTSTSPFRALKRLFGGGQKRAP